MKRNPNKNLISKLNKIGEELEFLSRPESRAAFVENLDGLISVLNRLRAGLTDPSLEAFAIETKRPLEQVVGFLEFAKSDEVLRILLSPTRRTTSAKAKRPAINIASDLTNDQIRALLERKLSKAELKLIAAQRAIAVGKSTTEEIKRDILRNLERQEGYGLLAAS